MIDSPRQNWDLRIEGALRSGHYTWLTSGLAGVPMEQALTEILTDIQHVCRRAGIDYDQLIAESRRQFEAEESGHEYEMAGTH